MRTVMIYGFCALVVAGLADVPSAVANSAPAVSNVTASQRADDSKLIDISYDLADTDGDPATVWVAVSDNDGASWRVPARTFSGDIGQGIAPGTGKVVLWDAGADVPGKVGTLTVRVFADDGNGPSEMVLVPIGPFPYQNNQADWRTVESFLIDKYEVTNQFYCQFLNNADPNGEHWSSSQEIDGFGEPGNYSYAVQPGREDFPIRYVNFYDAEAFAAWRSNLENAPYRLPTEVEWEKAAAWDAAAQHHYLYGFQRDSIDCSWCNYQGGSSSSCYGGPKPVGWFDGIRGPNDAKSPYGCYDMSGNVAEWTSSIYSGENRVARGGGYGASWYPYPPECRTTYRLSRADSERRNNLGFRLVRDLE